MCASSMCVWHRGVPRSTKEPKAAALGSPVQMVAVDCMRAKSSVMPWQGEKERGEGGKSCDWKRKLDTCGTRNVGLIGQRLRPSITPATTRGRGRRDKALSRILGGIEVRTRLCGNTCGQASVRIRVYSIRASFVHNRAPCTHALPPQQHPCGAPSPHTSPPGTHCGTGSKVGQVTSDP